MRLQAYDLLRATNRVTDGRGYEGLKAALERLAGTRIETNLVAGGREIIDGFGLIDQYRIVRQTRDGRMLDVEVRLSDWVFNAINAREVLTLHSDYFRLRKPLERRMYELGRKHCGQQPTWSISLETLQKKCGSNSTEKEFRRLVRSIIDQDQKHGHMPDYAVSMADDIVTFTNRREVASNGRTAAARTLGGPEPQIGPETFEKARKAAPGYDVHWLFREWVTYWREQGSKPLKSADAAFIGFCKKRAPLR